MIAREGAVKRITIFNEMAELVFATVFDTHV